MAGDFDYERHGAGYALQRHADPRIAAFVHAALGSARTVVNVGAGAGSYEPADRHVIAIEPSASMRAQRPADRPAVRGVAEQLPLDDDAVDAAMASITVHQWNDKAAGLAEMRRVSRGPVVILTVDGPALADFWLADYVPELVRTEVSRFPDVGWLCARLGGLCTVQEVPIPLDCTDGFGEAFYGRPERLLDPVVRAAQSAWGFITEAESDHGVAALRSALESGEWDEKYGNLRTQPNYSGAFRLITAERR